jgi:hypothetical protein
MKTQSTISNPFVASATTRFPLCEIVVVLPQSAKLWNGKMVKKTKRETITEVGGVYTFKN